MRSVLLLGIFAIVVGVLLARAAPASAQCECDYFNNANGVETKHVCYAFGCQSENCYPDICEQDTCNGTCPTGTAHFCVGFAYCGLPEVTGCENQTCG